VCAGVAVGAAEERAGRPGGVPTHHMPNPTQAARQEGRQPDIHRHTNKHTSSMRIIACSAVGMLSIPPGHLLTILLWILLPYDLFKLLSHTHLHPSTIHPLPPTLLTPTFHHYFHTHSSLLRDLACTRLHLSLPPYPLDTGTRTCCG